MISTEQISAENSLKVLLVGNYAIDRQESMRRFAELLARQLPDRGIRVECICPASVFGRLRPGAHGAGKWLGYLDKFVIFPGKLRKRVRQLSAESIVHICDHSNAVYTRVLAGVPHLVTCHDLLAVRSALGEFPGRHTRASGRAYQRWILRGLNEADRVACISTATRRDLLRLSKLEPRRVSLVPNGLNHPFAPLPEAVSAGRLREAAARFGGAISAKLQAGFILHVGGNHWYKNRPGVIQIYARLCDKMPQAPNLVMVGESFTPEMRRRISASHLEDRVVELINVANEDLQTLYCAARLMVFPSFEEGFGWPIVEAQACGCPVVIADREPMSEVGGEAAVLFKLESAGAGEGAPLSTRDADQAADIVMGTLLEASEERLDRVQGGLRNASRFSTDRMVDGYINLYRQMLSVRAEPQLRVLEPVSAR